MAEEDEFIVKSMLVVQGGPLKKDKWALEPKMVGGMPFFEAVISDRRFAKAMGMDMNMSNPWRGNIFLREIGKLRDEAIDVLINEHIRADDPLAEHAPDTKVPSRDRLNLYHQSDIPEIVKVTHPAFEVDGKDVAEFTFQVLATEKRGAPVTVEMSSAFLNWAKQAVAHYVDGRKRDLDHGGVELTKPNCKWRKLKQRHGTLYCRYRREDGKWRNHFESPKHNDDKVAYTQSVREAEERVQAFYDANHHPNKDDEDDPEDDLEEKAEGAEGDLAGVGVGHVQP